jgi:hypothetical protein
MPRAISQRVRLYLEDRLWLQVEIVSELEDLYGCDFLHHADLRAARRRLQHLCARLGHHTASFRLINNDTSIECKFCHAHCPVDRRTSDFHWICLYRLLFLTHTEHEFHVGLILTHSL